MSSKKRKPKSREDTLRRTMRNVKSVPSLIKTKEELEAFMRKYEKGTLPKSFRTEEDLIKFMRKYKKKV